MSQRRIYNMESLPLGRASILAGAIEIDETDTGVAGYIINRAALKDATKARISDYTPTSSGMLMKVYHEAVRAIDRVNRIVTDKKIKKDVQLTFQTSSSTSILIA